MFDEIRVREMVSRTQGETHSVVAKVLFTNGKSRGPEITVHVMVEADPSAPLLQIQRDLAVKAIHLLREVSELRDEDLNKLLRLGMRGVEDRFEPFQPKPVQFP